VTVAPRRTAFRVAAAALTVVAVLGVCEIACRAILGDRFVGELPPRRAEEVIGRHDPDIGWALTPGAHARVVAERATYDVALNSRGFRDVERGARRAGVRRIALVGDSYGFGWGVAQDETFGALLERDARVGAEVANLCVPGYSTDQELWTLEREGRSLAPDLVLVQFCPNDVDGVETTNSHRMLKPQFVLSSAGRWNVVNRPTASIVPVVAEPMSWGDRSLSWSAVWQVASRRTPLFASTDPPPAVAKPYGFSGRDPFAADGALRHAFELLAAHCRDIGARLVVFGVPTIGEPDTPPLVQDGVEYLYELNRGLARLGKDVGFATVSVDRALHDAHAAGVVVTIPDGHWNAAGHRLAAEALAPQLAKLLPSAK
jgi:hypothetical protein